jgi:predicted RNase H-like nuclease (RuvC/YqgF family)
MTMNSNLEAVIRELQAQLDEQGRRLENVESKLERLRDWMMQNVGRGKWQ